MVVGGPCIVTGCRGARLYGSEKCYKHRDIHDSALHTVENVDSLESTHSKIKQNLPTTMERSGSLIEYNIDGEKTTVESKNLDEMIESLSAAKKFWTVDLGLDEDEFVQYAIKIGKLEHWDDSEMLESKIMGQDQAIEILREKLTGPELIPGMWWGDAATNDPEADKEEDSVGPGQLSAMILLGIVVVFGFLAWSSGAGFNAEIVLADGIFQLICGGILALVGGAAALGRSEEGRFE